MKRTLLLALFICISAWLRAAVIEGKVPAALNDKMLVLIKINYDTRKDSTVKEVKVDAAGNFSISITLTEPYIFSLGEQGANPILHLLVKPNDTIHLHLDAPQISCTGSADTQYLIDYEYYRKTLFKKWLQPVYDSSAAADKAGNKAKLEYWNKQQTFASDQYKAELSSWVKQPFFINSLSAIHHSLRWHADNDIGLMDTMVANFRKQYKGYALTNQLENKVRRIKRTALGVEAPRFQSFDSTGQMISLGNYKGKYVLLDFWASWCTPCRQESPTLVRLYKTYKEKGFTILSVSVDDNRVKWLKAIKKDGLVWENVSELNGWSSPTAILYNVSAIPNSFLIDKQGKIIAKNLRGKDLEDKLAELLGK